MATIVFWAALLVFIAILAIGFFRGHRRGLKRQLVHIIFFVVAFVGAIFLTKTLTNAILNITISYEGSDMTLAQLIASMISSSFDLTDYPSLETFLNNIPAVIVAPIMYIVISLALLGVLEALYAIFARLAFGSKKKDFEEHKPRRWWGAGVGVVEAFLFMLLLLAPISSLVGMYGSLVETEDSTVQASEVVVCEEEETSSSQLQTVSELITTYVPSQINDILVGLDNSVFKFVCGIGGFDNAIYDYMAEITVEEETISFRKEVTLLVTIYDDFVEAYNTYTSDTFDATVDTISLTNLKTSLESFLDSGLFRSVVTDTLVTYVSNYDTTENSLNLPDVAVDIFSAMQDVFKEEGFDGKTYLKENLLAAMDVASELFDSNLIGKFQALDTSDSSTLLTTLLEFVSDNSTSVKSLVNNLFSIDIVEKSFPALCDFASDYLADYFATANEEYATENGSQLTIALNSDIADTSVLIDDILTVVNELLDLNEEIELSSLLDGDLTSSITSTTDTDALLDKLGSTLDDLRELEIFVIEGTETTYVLDNILTLMDVQILGDTVTTSEGEVTLDTYTKFCNYLKEPVANAQALGYFDGETLDFDTIIDNLLEEVSEDSTFLSDTIMPFYQLSVLNLKETVFDSVVTLLVDSTEGLLDIDDTLSTYTEWKAQFDELESVLNLLNRGSVGEESLTYIKYILENPNDLDTLVTSMRNGEYAVGQTDLNAVLNKIFVSDLTKSLTVTVFDYIDSQVKKITNVKPTTFASTDKISITTSNVESVVSTIESLLDYADALSTEIDLTTVGKIMDLLKSEAYNSGAKDGVFNPIFCNLVWYLTGDAIDGLDYSSYSSYEDSDYVKAYLNTSGDEYYSISYEVKFGELDTVVELADALSAQGIESGKISLSGKDAAELATYLSDLMSKFKSALESVKTDLTEQKTVVDNLKKLLTNMESPLLDSGDVKDYGTYIDSAVTTTFDDGDADYNDEETLLTASIQALLKLTIATE